MPRFYAPPSQWDGQFVSLDAAEGRHAVEVMRLKEGSSAVVFDGFGKSATAVLRTYSKRGVDFEFQSFHLDPKPNFNVTLVQSLPRGKLMEWIVEKAVELGVTRVVPILSERTVVRLDDEERARKQEKWFRVAVEACKQSGQNWIPQIDIPQNVSEVMAASPQVGELSLIGSLRESACPIAGAFSKAQFDAIRLIVGPEGDFSEAELEAFVAKGALEVSLGRLTLRSETAALYMLCAASCLSERFIDSPQI
jgi:16S rRNA (uracil1498-N3)-methyltransferase